MSRSAVAEEVGEAEGEDEGAEAAAVFPVGEALLGDAEAAGEVFLVFVPVGAELADPAGERSLREGDPDGSPGATRVPGSRGVGRWGELFRRGATHGGGEKGGGAEGRRG